MQKRKRISADQKLLQLNNAQNLVQSSRVRSKDSNVISVQEIEIQRLQKYIDKLENDASVENEDTDDDADDDFDFNENAGNEYNIQDQMKLDFLETMTIRGGSIKLVSVTTLRSVSISFFRSNNVWYLEFLMTY